MFPPPSPPGSVTQQVAGAARGPGEGVGGGGGAGSCRGAAVIDAARPHKLCGRSPRESSLTATSRAPCQNLKHFQPLIEQEK